MAGEQPLCPHCAGATAAREERGKRALGVGRLRPDIVLYGEEHPHAHLISPIVQHDLSLNPDMMLILGTSMRVHGLKVLVKEFAKSIHNKGGKVVFINFTKPPDSVWADIIDYWIQSDCDAWVNDLRKRKPALFLPPGSVIEEEVTKPPKIRRSSTSQSKTKRKRSGENVKQQESESIRAKTKDEIIAASITVGSLSDISKEPSEKQTPATPEKADEKAVSAAAAGEISQTSQDPNLPGPRAKPRKIGPNTKRAPVVRDDKANGAWLVYSIMTSLKRITGGEIAPSANSSPAPKPKPKTKRPRKSAPAALALVDADRPGASSPTAPGSALEAERESQEVLPSVPGEKGKQPMQGVFRVSAPTAKKSKPRGKKATQAGTDTSMLQEGSSSTLVLSSPLPFHPSRINLRGRSKTTLLQLPSRAGRGSAPHGRWLMASKCVSQSQIGEDAGPEATTTARSKKRKAEKQQASGAPNPESILPRPKTTAPHHRPDQIRGWNRTPDNASARSNLPLLTRPGRHLGQDPR